MRIKCGICYKGAFLPCTLVLQSLMAQVLLNHSRGDLILLCPIGKRLRPWNIEFVKLPFMC